jgi:hypothetical protein
VKIDIPDLTQTLGPSWKKADADVNGEFGYLVALAEYISKRTARAAAEGWGGDRYVLYENKSTGALVLIQFTTWDTEKDAQEFFDAYVARTEKRYKLGKQSELSSQPRVYDTNEGLTAIERRGKDVLLIEGVQKRDQLARVMERAWQSTKR